MDVAISKNDFICLQTIDNRSNPKECDIGDASKQTLSSYAYMLMMIYFLQQISPPVLPVLQEMYEGEQPEVSCSVI